MAEQKKEHSPKFRRNSQDQELDERRSSTDSAVRQKAENTVSIIRHSYEEKKILEEISFRLDGIEIQTFTPKIGGLGRGGYISTHTQADLYLYELNNQTRSQRILNRIKRNPILGILSSTLIFLWQFVTNFLYTWPFGQIAESIGNIYKGKNRAWNIAKLVIATLTAVAFVVLGTLVFTAIGASLATILYVPAATIIPVVAACFALILAGMGVGFLILKALKHINYSWKHFFKKEGVVNELEKTDDSKFGVRDGDFADIEAIEEFKEYLGYKLHKYSFLGMPNPLNGKYKYYQKLEHAIYEGNSAYIGTFLEHKLLKKNFRINLDSQKAHNPNKKHIFLDIQKIIESQIIQSFSKKLSDQTDITHETLEMLMEKHKEEHSLEFYEARFLKELVYKAQFYHQSIVNIAFTKLKIQYLKGTEDISALETELKEMEEALDQEDSYYKTEFAIHTVYDLLNNISKKDFSDKESDSFRMSNTIQYANEVFSNFHDVDLSFVTEMWGEIIDRKNFIARFFDPIKSTEAEVETEQKDLKIVEIDGLRYTPKINGKGHGGYLTEQPWNKDRSTLWNRFKLHGIIRFIVSVVKGVLEITWMLFYKYPIEETFKSLKNIYDGKSLAKNLIILGGIILGIAVAVTIAVLFPPLAALMPLLVFTPLALKVPGIILCGMVLGVGFSKLAVKIINYFKHGTTEPETLAHDEEKFKENLDPGDFADSKAIDDLQEHVHQEKRAGTLLNVDAYGNAAMYQRIWTELEDGNTAYVGSYLTDRLADLQAKVTAQELIVESTVNTSFTMSDKHLQQIFNVYDKLYSNTKQSDSIEKRIESVGKILKEDTYYEKYEELFKLWKAEVYRDDFRDKFFNEMTSTKVSLLL